MIGIYKITNLVNGKAYIGQSKDIEKRFQVHRFPSSRTKSIVSAEIQKYGVENFKFEVLQECGEEELDELEIKYIALYHTQKPNGYNIAAGGKDNSHLNAEGNPCHKLAEEDVYQIREDYKNMLTKMQAYEKVKDIISYNTFADIWIGKTWKSVHYDVYTAENKEKHRTLKDATRHCHVVSYEDVLEIRQLRDKGRTKAYVLKEYSHINKNTFEDIWYDRTFPFLQSGIKEKKRPSKEEVFLSRSGCNNHRSNLSEETILEIRRRRDNGESIRVVHRDFPTIQRHSFSNIWYNRSYKNVLPL